MTLGGMALIGAVITGIGLVGVLSSFFVLNASVGLIAPNTTALALDKTSVAGSASALLGVVQISIGVIVAPLIGLGGSESAVPMAAAIAAFGMATLVTVILVCRPFQKDATTR
jgi:MFS transporter, DHA1 family, multidrug resistance protein